MGSRLMDDEMRAAHSTQARMQYGLHLSDGEQLDSFGKKHVNKWFLTPWNSDQKWLHWCSPTRRHDHSYIRSEVNDMRESILYGIDYEAGTSKVEEGSCAAQPLKSNSKTKFAEIKREWRVG